MCTIPETLMVVNPFTNEQIDVLPYLKMIKNAELRGGSHSESMQAVHDRLSIMYLNRESTLEPEKLAELCYICIETRDTLKSIKV